MTEGEDPTGTPEFEKARALATALHEAFQHGEDVGALEECRHNMLAISIVGGCSIVAQLAVMVVFLEWVNWVLVIAQEGIFIAAILVTQLGRLVVHRQRCEEQLHVVLQRLRSANDA